MDRHTNKHPQKDRHPHRETVQGLQGMAHPERTPRTRLRTKNEPIMMRGMKYIQLNMDPRASFA